MISSTSNSPAAKKYDVVVPIDTHSGIDFDGSSGKHSSFNHERAFKVLQWPATLHATDSERYIVVRTNCEEAEARKALDLVTSKLPLVSVVLDVGFRPAAHETVISKGIADLEYNSLVPAGEMPRVQYGETRGSIRIPISSLSDAFAASAPPAENLDRAMELYADTDFEASVTSRFVLLTTALEVLATRRQRDQDALGLLEKWAKEAKEGGRSDLVTALDLMREESIGSSIRELVRLRCQEAGEEKAQAMAKSAGKLYGRRGAVLHAGAGVSFDEIVELRRIVRHTLLGSSKGGLFSGVVEKLNQQARRPDYGPRNF